MQLSFMLVNTSNSYSLGGSVLAVVVNMVVKNCINQPHEK